jgi:hypothetical protein
MLDIDTKKIGCQLHNLHGNIYILYVRHRHLEDWLSATIQYVYVTMEIV